MQRLGSNAGAWRFLWILP